jgi:hypothetical protein
MMQKKSSVNLKKCFKDPILTKELVKLGHALKNWESHEMTTLNYKKNGEEFWVNFALTQLYTHWLL